MPDPQSTATSPALYTDRIRAMDETLYVLEFIDRSDRYRRSFVEVWDEVLSNYLVNPFVGGGMRYTHTRNLGATVPAYHTMAGLPAAGMGGSRYRRESILKDPETHQIVESVASQGLVMLLGQREYITVSPFGRGDYDKARMLAMLIQTVMSQSGVYKTHYQLIKDAFIFGTAIIEIGWETRSRMQYVPEGNALVPREVLYRDAPLQRVVDIYDFYPDPSGTRIQEDMIGVAKRFTVTAQEALRLARAGVYDGQAVREAIGRAIRPSKEPGSGSTNPNIRKRFEGQIADLPTKFMPLDGFEYWGESPITTPDKVYNRVITLLNGVNVRSRGIPFLDGCIPFKEIVVNPLAGRFYGISPAEVVRFLQDSTDAMLMAYTDIVSRALKGPLLIGQSWGGNEQDLKDLPSIIACADVKQVAPLPLDINVLQFVAAEIGRRKLSMREAAGDTNPLERISGDRQAATTTSEIVRLAATRTEPMIQLIEREDYPWIGRTLHARLRQFLPAGGAVAVIGGESIDVPFEAIDIDADVRFSGARQGGSRYQRLVQNREIASILGSPVGRQLLLTAPEVLVRMIRDGLDVPDAEDLVERAQQRTLALMQLEMTAAAAQQAAKSGGGPPSGGNGQEPTPGSAELPAPPAETEGGPTP